MLLLSPVITLLQLNFWSNAQSSREKIESYDECSRRTLPIMSGKTYNHFLLTGPPGVGKTTLIKDIVSKLRKKQIPCLGFFTEEIRENGVRTGFEIVSVDRSGARKPLALLSDGRTPGPKVGRYAVDVSSFESFIRPVMEEVYKSKETNVLILDEIGKMECFSSYFESAVHKLFQKVTKSVIVGTIPVRHSLQVVTQISGFPNVEQFTVNIGNRDLLVDELTNLIIVSHNKLQKA